MFKIILQLLQVLVPILSKSKKEESVDDKDAEDTYNKNLAKSKKELISFQDYITSSGSYPERLLSDELTPEKIQNAYKLLDKINPFLEELGITSVKVSSGFRTLAANKKAGGANKSLHCQSLAVDFEDKDGKLRESILNNLEVTKKHVIYIEDFRWTVGWVHCQVQAPTSKRRIFIPSSVRPTDSKIWDGKYDSKLDG